MHNHPVELSPPPIAPMADKTMPSLNASAAPMPVAKRGWTPIERGLQAVLLINLIALLLYLGFSYKFAFHSDSAAANLLAQEIVDTGSYFPIDWNYVNGDLWVLFVQTWIVPFLPFFDNGYGLHAAGGVISAALVLGGTWCVCRVMGLSRAGCLLALALVASGFSPNMSENVYGQQAYGTIYSMGCFVLCASYSFLHGDGRARWAWAAAATLLMLLLAWANPQRAIVYNVLPILAASVWWYCAQGRAMPRAGGIRVDLTLLFLFLAVSLIAGAVLNGHFLNRGHSSLTPVTINWLAFDAMAGNLKATVQGFLSLLSGLPRAGEPVANVRGGINAIRLVSAATILFLSIWALMRSVGSAHPGRLFIGVATLASIASNLFIFVTTTLPFTGTPESSVRYLMPSLLGMVLLLVAAVTDGHRAGLKRVFGGLAIAVIMLTAPVAYELPALLDHRSVAAINQANPHVRLTNFLLDQKLEYGYASFWNAGRTTVLSKHAVKVRQIAMNNGLPQPMRHLSSDRWYQPEAWNGPTFLLLSNEEMASVKWDTMKQLCGEPLRMLAFEDYRIAVFDHNIARDFPSWSVRVQGTVHYRMTDSAQHEVGRFDVAERALVAEPGDNGTLHFGPYQSLEAGRYQATFLIEAQGADQLDYGRVDVVADSGKQNFGVVRIERPGVQRLTLPVDVDRFVRGLEFRVFTTGAGKVVLRGIELSNSQQTSPSSNPGAQHNAEQ